MTVDEVRKSQLRQLEMLKYFDGICRTNGLTYYVHAGTLLGAVRHGGYIPWDMDTDVVMPWEDAEKFLTIVEAEHNNRYKVLRAQDSWTFSDRLVDGMTKCYGSAATTEEDKYPHIDISAYGNTRSHHPMTIKLRAYWNRLVGRTIEFRFGRNMVAGGRIKQSLKLLLLHTSSFLLRRYSDDALRESIRRFAIQEEESGRITIYNSFYGIAKETYNAEAFSKAEYMPFEDMTVPVPCGYENVLSRLYGDWRQLPPEDKRYPDYLSEMIYEETAMGI